jgi:hypothetical protein
MAIKYGVYSAVTGENTVYNTKEQALQAFWVNVVSFAKSHFHNTSYTIIDQKEDGTEVWYNDNNEEIDKPMSKEEIEAILSKV